LNLLHSEEGKGGSLPLKERFEFPLRKKEKRKKIALFPFFINLTDKPPFPS
jgi:hypothetical protein